MSEGHRVVGDDSSNVYEKCAGTPVWCGASGDTWKEPCYINEVKCDGEREVAVLWPGPESEE